VSAFHAALWVMFLVGLGCERPDVAGDVFGAVQGGRRGVSVVGDVNVGQVDEG
jgi:hypothetical protein